ncbi:hypothetical protein D3C75_1342940 [compost metagenome]
MATAVPRSDQGRARAWPLGVFEGDVEAPPVQRGFSEELLRVFGFVLSVVDRAHFQPSAVFIL